VPLARRGVEQVAAVHREQVEEDGGDRQQGARGVHIQLGADPARHLLEGARPAVLAEGDHLAVEHRGIDRQLPGGGHDLGQPVGDLIERTGVDPYVIALPVHLHPDAVELLLDRARAQLVQRLVHVLRRPREHRLHRMADGEPELGHRLRPSGQQRLSHHAQRTAEHHRPPHLRGTGADRRGQPLGGERVQRALPHLPADQAGQKALLFLRGRGHQRVQQPLALRLGALAGHGRDRVQRRVHPGHRQPGLGGGRLPLLERTPAHPGLALRRPPGQIGDHQLRLVRLGRPEQLGQQGGLLRTRTGGRDLP
jgi:hypothetical protein